MKKSKHFFKKQGDQTDVDSSVAYAPANKQRQKRKRVPKYVRQLKRLRIIATYLKILRFRGYKSNKIHRFYCYDEDSLGWPVRFTKKLNKMTSDNDRESDQQNIEMDKNRCLKSLFQAIEQRKKGKQLNF